MTASNAVRNSIDLHSLVDNIAHYILSLKSQIPSSPEVSAAKKRKLNDGTPNGASAASSIHGAWKATESFPGISFSIPQRKKLALEISSSKTEGIRALTSTEAEKAEFGIPWASVEHVICLPVPDKAQAQKNFCVIPVGGDGLGGDVGPYETIVWTAADTKAKGADPDGPTQAEAISAALAKAKIKVQVPDENEFASEVPLAANKGERAYHVKGFRGSKEGSFYTSKSLPPSLTR